MVIGNPELLHDMHLGSSESKLKGGDFLGAGKVIAYAGLCLSSTEGFSVLETDDNAITMI